MTSKKTIENINSRMERGDKRKIAEASGLTVITVSRFFNGRESEITDDTSAKILKAALSILSNRKSQEKAISKKLNSLL